MTISTLTKSQKEMASSIRFWAIEKRSVTETVQVDGRSKKVLDALQEAGLITVARSGTKYWTAIVKNSPLWKDIRSNHVNDTTSTFYNRIIVTEDSIVRLKDEVENGHSCPEGRVNNATAKVVGYINMQLGSLKLAEDLRGCQYWNVDDVEIVNKF